MPLLRPRALLLAALFVSAAACKSGEKAASTPVPTSTPSAPTARPQATPFELSAFPEAWRADAPHLPRHVQEPLAFVKKMLDEHSATMDAITCHCCAKSLTKCYVDTALRAAKACSPL